MISNCKWSIKLGDRDRGGERKKVCVCDKRRELDERRVKKRDVRREGETEGEKRERKKIQEENMKEKRKLHIKTKGKEHQHKIISLRI